jgi:hypothetical protein
MNSGWTVSHTAGISRGLVMWAGEGIGRLMAAIGRPLTIMSVHRGAPFITQLRLQWLATSVPADVRVVQILGSVDDVVSPIDSIDPVTGRDFVYLEVPHTTHANVVQMDGSAGDRRRLVFKEALGEKQPTFGRDTPVLVRNAAVAPDKSVTDVVFVIHGIRDEGHWTERIARRVQLRAEAENEKSRGHGKRRKVEIVTAGYGYFPMLSFLRPGARQEKVEWLMDQYTVAKARYPNAAFSYVGHSNGTYLLAEAMEHYPAVSFQRVLFAGSVVRTDYNWEPRRVQQLMNVRAHNDLVVAWFPGAFEQVGWQDVGGAGFWGFQSQSPSPNAINMQDFAVGGHSAAVEEDWWGAIAGYIVTGKLWPADTVKEQSWVRYPAKAAWIIWILLASVVALIYWGISRLRLREWKKTLVFVFFTWVLWFIVTAV